MQDPQSAMDWLSAWGVVQVCLCQRALVDVVHEVDLAVDDRYAEVIDLGKAEEDEHANQVVEVLGNEKMEVAAEREEVRWEMLVEVPFQCMAAVVDDDGVVYALVEESM